MTYEEYINLKVGDWILFHPEIHFNWSDRLYGALVDGKPHMITRAGNEGLFHRLGFINVHTPYDIGWCYHDVDILSHMKKIPVQYEVVFTKGSDLVEGDLIFIDNNDGPQTFAYVIECWEVNSIRLSCGWKLRNVSMQKFFRITNTKFQMEE